MDYEGRICNTPFERSSFKLPVMVGCSYNRCKFCGLFKHLSYRELPLEQIEAELARVRAVGGRPTRVALGDGNAFCLETEHLEQILRLVHAYLPTVETVSTDATVTSIRGKSDDELRCLAALGLQMLYIGVESGLDDVLSFMRKEHDNAQLREAVRRLHAAGMGFGAHIMTGVAGAGRGIENARATAALLNETRPDYICNFSMIVEGHPVELSEDVREGLFTPASDLETLREDQELVRCLNIPVRFEGFHDMIGVRVHGTLPKDEERIIAALERAVAAQLRELRTKSITYTAPRRDELCAFG